MLKLTILHPHRNRSHCRYQTSSCGKTIGPTECWQGAGQGRTCGTLVDWGGSDIAQYTPQRSTTHHSHSHRKSTCACPSPSSDRSRSAADRHIYQDWWPYHVSWDIPLRAVFSLLEHLDPMGHQQACCVLLAYDEFLEHE